jgi:hypothetical protein
VSLRVLYGGTPSIVDECASLMVEYRTTKRIQEQYTAFMEGFNELISQELANVFDERELELLIGGISESTCPNLPPLWTNSLNHLYLFPQSTLTIGSNLLTTVGTRPTTR